MIVVIQKGSQAWRELADIFDPNQAGRTLRKVSIDLRDVVTHPDGESKLATGIAVKVNEYMWSPTLDVT